MATKTVTCFRHLINKELNQKNFKNSICCSLETAQVGCMRQALGPGALGRARGIGWRGRWEGGAGWGTHVNPWLIHFNV